MSYFKYNRTQYLPSVPFLVAKELSPDGAGGYNGTVVPDARDNYMSVSFLPRDMAVDGLPDIGTVGRVRSARVGGLPLYASDAEQMAEVNEAVLTQLRAMERVTVNGTEYTLLGVTSDVFHLWDESRPLKVDQQRTKFWDDRPPIALRLSSGGLSAIGPSQTGRGAPSTCTRTPSRHSNMGVRCR